MTAFLLTAPPALAGDRVHASHRTTPRPQPAPVLYRPVFAPVTIAVAATPTAPVAGETPSISLRGPDGQLRSFPVEGARTRCGLES